MYTDDERRLYINYLKKMRLRDKIEHFKKRNKEYFKGQHGQRFYYDYEKRFANSDDNEEYLVCNLYDT